MRAITKSHAHNAVKRQVSTLLIMTRNFSSSLTPSNPPSSSTAPVSQSGVINPLHLGLSQLVRPGGRQSVSGIVATVFGSSGFLARYVVGELGMIGSQVIVPYRGDGMKMRHLKLAGDVGQIVPIPFDLADMASIQRCLSRSNVVINCIGSDKETMNYSYDDVNAKISYRLAQCAKAAGVERFIQVSAFGASPSSDSAFFRSKAEGEKLVREFYPDATIIRPTVMFGEHDNWLNRYAFLAKNLAAVPITRQGQRRVQPVYVHDVARAILGSISDPNSAGRTYELAGPEIFTEQQILDLVNKYTMRDTPAFYMNDKIASIYSTIIGGTRNFRPSFGNNTLGKILSSTTLFLNKLSFPMLFNPDQVVQAHVDLVSALGQQNLKELGIQHPTPLEAKIDRTLFSHRSQAPDRFPESQRMRSDAQKAASGVSS